MDVFLISTASLFLAIAIAALDRADEFASVVAIVVTPSFATALLPDFSMTDDSTKAVEFAAVNAVATASSIEVDDVRGRPELSGAAALDTFVASAASF